MCKKECGDWPAVPRKDAGHQTSTEFSQGLGWGWELLTSVGGEEQEFQAGVLHRAWLPVVLRGRRGEVSGGWGQTGGWDYHCTSICGSQTSSTLRT